MISYHAHVQTLLQRGGIDQVLLEFAGCTGHGPARSTRRRSAARRSPYPGARRWYARFVIPGIHGRGVHGL